MKLLIRADASATIGSGHIVRCMTLARALLASGVESTFVCKPATGDLNGLIQDQGFVVHRHRPPNETSIGDAQALFELIEQEGLQPDRILVDHYGLGGDWEELLERVCPVMAIDDTAERNHAADILLDQNLVANYQTRYDTLTNPSCHRLLGPEYALLQPEYAALRPQAKAREGPVRRILLYFGATDNHGLNELALRALLHTCSDQVQIDLVLPQSIADQSRILALASDSPTIRCHSGLRSLAHLYLHADFAIGAAGSSSWERLCLGVPSIAISVADNQIPIAEELHARGLLNWLGQANAIDEATLRVAIAKVVKEGLDPAWSKNCMTVVDGRGTARVCAVLTAEREVAIVARLATPMDEARILRWANDVETRRNALSTRQIGAQEHSSWFGRILADQATVRMFVLETDGGAELGQVRFQRQESRWEIHYGLAPEFRGRHLAAKCLTAAIQAFRLERANPVLFGQVKATNPRSIRVFESIGFTRARVNGDVIEYVSSLIH